MFGCESAHVFNRGSSNISIHQTLHFHNPFVLNVRSGHGATDAGDPGDDPHGPGQDPSVHPHDGRPSRGSGGVEREHHESDTFTCILPGGLPGFPRREEPHGPSDSVSPIVDQLVQMMTKAFRARHARRSADSESTEVYDFDDTDLGTGEEADNSDNLEQVAKNNTNNTPEVDARGGSARFGCLRRKRPFELIDD